MEGKKTSEWMVTLGAIASAVLPTLAVLLDHLVGSGLVKNPHVVAIFGMIGAVLASLGYGAGRTYLKATAMKTRALTDLGKPANEGAAASQDSKPA